MALPAYQNYTVKAKMSEVVLAASACRTTITEVAQTTTSSTLPDANNWGCEQNADGTDGAPTKYVESITTDNTGVITVKTTTAADLPTDAQGKSITLTPYTDENTALTNDDAGEVIYKWVCGPASTDGVPNTYLPGSCQG